MPIKQISSEEAKELLDSGEGYIYLDVRSEYEFQQGHPRGAVNIPLQQLNESMQSLEPNPEFVDVVEAVRPDTGRMWLVKSWHNAAINLSPTSTGDLVGSGICLEIFKNRAGCNWAIPCHRGTMKNAATPS